MFRKISEHLYVFDDTCQVYAVKGKRGAVLIDFGSGEVLEHLPEIGAECVEAVLLTHHHRDQAQGLLKAWEKKIPIYVPHAERELIEGADFMWQSREIYNNYNNRQDRFSVLNSVPVTDTLKDYATVTFGDVAFCVLPTPGHTTGAVTLETTADGKKVAFTGDLIYGKGKVWSLAATQWTYNGGEGIAHSILSLLYLKERNIDLFLPSHGNPMEPKEAVDPTVERLAELRTVRKQNPRLFSLRKEPYQKVTEHVLFNRTSMCDSYVLVSESGKALVIDLGYDFMAGVAAGTDRSSRRPWLYTIPALFETYGVTKIDACICTHYHDDHVAGFNLLHDTYGAQVWCAESFADILEHPCKYDIPCLWYDPIPVDRRLPLNLPVRWEEYEIILHPFSGHTRYAVAIEFVADGKKFLCTGDQYADDDGLFCNYVYKNRFDYDDFVNSAALICSIRPDHILTGHWQYRDRDEAYYEKLAQIGDTVQRLHRELLPLEEIAFGPEGFCAGMSPYQAEVLKGERFTADIQVINPLPHRAKIQVRLVLPAGFWAEDAGKFVWEADARESCHRRVTIQAAKEEVRRARIGCDVTADDRKLGEQAEMLVTVR